MTRSPTPPAARASASTSDSVAAAAAIAAFAAILLLLPAPFAVALPSTRPAGDGGRPGAAGPPIFDIDRIVRSLDDKPPGPGPDPLRAVAGDMSGIVVRLGDLKTDKPVQAKQEQVVRTLDLVIKELEKQCKGGGGGGGGGRPLGRSTLAGGPGGQGEMIDPRQGDKQWAALPARQRDQILQSQTEGFPPGYEAVLQSYYRRLSQEQVTPDGSAPPPAAPPAPAPANVPAPATRPSNP